jgi:cytochrome c-type protein NapB
MTARKRKFVAGGAVALAVCGIGVLLATVVLRPHRSQSLSEFQVRAARRAYDGAPPVIPHPPLGSACTNCHTETPREFPGVGIAPPNPHLKTAGLSEASRCRQCHVFAVTGELFATNSFEGLEQKPRRGNRLYPHAPPVMPHHVFMREDCLSCHSGPGVRQEIRCTHPDRINCVQCHVLP